MNKWAKFSASKMFMPATRSADLADLLITRPELRYGGLRRGSREL